MRVPRIVKFYSITATYVAIMVTVILVLLVLDLRNTPVGHTHTDDCSAVSPERNDLS